MKYNIKKLENRGELEKVKLVFYEDKDTDNCYYLIQSDELSIGISYYDLGIKPCIKVLNTTIFIGFGCSIVIYNFVNLKVLYYDVDALHVVFDSYFIDKFNYVLFICELKLLCFDTCGHCVWECGFLDVISDWSFKESNIILSFNGKSDLKISVCDGKVKC